MASTIAPILSVKIRLICVQLGSIYFFSWLKCYQSQKIELARMLAYLSYLAAVVVGS